MAGHYADFAAFFETLISVKHQTGVHNTAVALRLMAEMAGEVLAAKEADAENSQVA